jgi:hypothetical protein
MKERGLRSSCPFRARMLGVFTLSTTKEAPVREFYEGLQFVGMDLHRRRSVLVRMTESGEHLETVRILNDRDSLADVMSRAGQSPEVVLKATYGSYWATGWADYRRVAKTARTEGRAKEGGPSSRCRIRSLYPKRDRDVIESLTRSCTSNRRGTPTIKITTT